MVGFGFGPDTAVVAFGDAFDEGQADAVAIEVGFFLEFLKNLEKFVGVLHVEADAVVANPIDLSAVLLGGAEFEDGRVLTFGEFKGVGDELFPGEVELREVGLGRRKFGEFDLDVLFFGKGGEDVAGQLGHVDGRFLDGLFANAMEGEQVLDEAAHDLSVVEDVLEEALAFFVDLGAVIFGEDAAEAFDGAKRSAEIVGDRVGK